MCRIRSNTGPLTGESDELATVCKKERAAESILADWVGLLGMTDSRLLDNRPRKIIEHTFHLDKLTNAQKFSPHYFLHTIILNEAVSFASTDLEYTKITFLSSSHSNQVKLVSCLF